MCSVLKFSTYLMKNKQVRTQHADVSEADFHPTLSTVSIQWLNTMFINEKKKTTSKFGYKNNYCYMVFL